MGGCLATEELQKNHTVVDTGSGAPQPSDNNMATGPDAKTTETTPESRTSSDVGRGASSAIAEGGTVATELVEDPSAMELTEQALKQLNMASTGSRRGKPSSTGGTTANTRPTDLPDLPEGGDVGDITDLAPEPHPQPHVEGVNFAVPEEMPQGTPPPVPEGLPVVSLSDIALMEQKKGLRGRRVKSRRGSTTASHASLSAIPENVEITPLHARTERSDSLRDRVSLSQQGVNRLAEVQELEVESKSNTGGNTSRPSHADSPRSSSSVLTSGDDSVMPQNLVDSELELHMPILANPRAYFRFPNATEAYRGSHRLAVSQQSTALSSAVSSQSESGHVERVLTDDSGLQLTGSSVTYNNGESTVELPATKLKLAEMVERGEEELSLQDVPEVQQGTLQQETIRFMLPESVEGLRCVKKYAVGEHSWDQVVMMGDFEAGEHEFAFAESRVPIGLLNLGQYRMKTVFMDAHGKYLWAGVHNFQVTKSDQQA